jgi:hypothetical protein
MTHDELLAKIDAAQPNYDCECKGMDVALWSIVKLHKPIEDEWFNIGKIICEECSREEYTQEYPCLTIQAIQKELNNANI